MAEPLKNAYGPEVPRRIADMVVHVHPTFPKAAFLRDALAGYEAMELMPRGRHLAGVLRTHLPDSYVEAIAILVRSMDAPVKPLANKGMASFLFMPHAYFVANFGLDHFEPSMAAHYAITQRFTAEFSIRPFLEKFPDQTLARLEQWASDPNEHIRRLVSEGTRPRLPWASRLSAFQRDPSPVLALLERLRDDPALYVRRSVANNLNDIGKDHPDTLIATAKRWMINAPDQRQWIVRHALRSLLKQGNPEALAVLGYKAAAGLAVREASVAPKRVQIGQAISVTLDVVNNARSATRVMADFCVHFVKAGGRTSGKVFKLRSFSLAPGESRVLTGRVSLAPMTTRRLYPGTHRVDVLVNGETTAAGAFELEEARSSTS